jgi:hypothetical protein
MDSTDIIPLTLVLLIPVHEEDFRMNTEEQALLKDDLYQAADRLMMQKIQKIDAKNLCILHSFG